MGFSITCDDCGHKRSNAQYKNTKFCHQCRMLRDLLFAGLATRKCSDAACSKTFAPVVRRDALCGDCHFGNIYAGDCKFCHRANVDLHRPGIAVCVRCVRDPKQRKGIVEGLKKGQRARRAANNHVAKES
jgi:hypothetical protein